MAANQNFMLKFHMTYFGKSILNVFFYRQYTGTGNALELLSEFDTTIPPVLKTIQNTSVAYDDIEVINLSDLEDFGSADCSTAAGTYATGDPLAAFLASSFIYHRASRAVRNGSKRFCGISEGMIVGDSFSGAILTALQNVATVLQQSLDDGSGNVWNPMIARRTTVGGVVTYTLFVVTGVDYRAVYTTQNTRK